MPERRAKTPPEIVQEDVRKQTTAERIRWAQIIATSVVGILTTAILGLVGICTSYVTDLKAESSALREAGMRRDARLDAIVSQQQHDRDESRAQIGEIKSLLNENKRQIDVAIAQLSSKYEDLNIRFSVFAAKQEKGQSK